MCNKRLGDGGGGPQGWGLTTWGTVLTWRTNLAVVTTAWAKVSQLTNQYTYMHFTHVHITCSCVSYVFHMSHVYHKEYGGSE